MKKIIILFLLILILVSCSTIEATYSISLSQVERPIDSKQEFSDVKVIKYNEEGINKYEDEYINIVWNVEAKTFNFTLKNKTSHTLKINWDNASYIDVNGNVSRLIHSNIKYVDKNNLQPPTIIPKGGVINDILLPTNNIYSIYREYQEKNLIPSFYRTIEDMENNANYFVNKKMAILLPIIIKGVQNDYIFTFNINKWINK